MGIVHTLDNESFAIGINQLLPAGSEALRVCVNDCQQKCQDSDRDSFDVFCLLIHNTMKKTCSK